MAQRVAYSENDVTYTEGPFVMVNVMGNWRIEVELKNHHCPVLASASIYQLLEKEGLYHFKTRDEKKVEKAVDWLNQQVKEGFITLKGRQWVYC